MSRRAVPLAIAFGVCIVFAKAAAPQSVSIEATAGLGGYTRPGRWTPVRVAVTSARPMDGEVTLEWGTARMHRLVSLTPGNVRHLELTLRTQDPRDVVTVRLIDGERTHAEALVPIRVLPHHPESALVVCGPEALAADRSCTAGIDLAALPHSWRGYDAADHVRLSEGERRALDVRQRAALTLALAQARLLRAGLGTPTIGPVPTDRASTQRSLLLLGGYALAFLAILSGVRLRHPVATITAIALTGGIGSMAVAAAGRAGPGASIVIHHAAALDEYEGANSAVLTLRGVAEFPRFGDYSLQSAIEDASLLIQGKDDQDVARIGPSGFPVLAGRFGRGATTAFVMEAAASPTMLGVARHGVEVRVTNRSIHTLERCRFSAQPSAPAADLLPGAVAIGVIGTGDPDPTFTCQLARIPWSLSEARHPVVMNGETTITIHLDPGSDDVAAGSDL